MRPWIQNVAGSTAARMGAAFGAVLLLFAAALLMTFRTLERLEIAESEVVRLDEAKHAGHLVAGLVREEYIHQAHTIIEWDRSHVAHYGTAARQARQGAARLVGMNLTPEERRQALQIQALERRIDEDFLARILPAVDARDAESVHDWHLRTEAMVNQVVEINEVLNQSLERRSQAALAMEEGLRSHASRVVLGCFALAIAVTVAGWLLLGQSVVKRIRVLRDGALTLAAGDLKARVNVSGSDELAELGRSFNQMAVSLRRNQEELMHAQRLAILGQVATGVAHEINNPLAVILGYLKLAVRNPQTSAEVIEQLQIVEDEARQCQRIVQHLLDMGRPVPAERSRVNLTELARDALDRLSESGNLGNRTIFRPALDDRAVVRGDPAGLRQVITNLLLNAIDATGDTGSIAVRVAIDESVVLCVEDDGAGAPSEVLARVFEPFFTTKSKGTGLGLSISQAIVTAHHGTLELVPSPVRGALARVSLPRAAGEERKTH